MPTQQWQICSSFECPRRSPSLQLLTAYSSQHRQITMSECTAAIAGAFLALGACSAAVFIWVTDGSYLPNYSSQGQCASPSITPIQVSVAIGCFMVSSLIGTAFVSAKRVQSRKGRKGCCVLLFDIWRRKSIYFSPILHLADTISDYAAAVEFYLLATTKSKDDCS